MSYARVLLAGRPLQGDADPLSRLREALRAHGHAATMLENADPSCGELRAFAGSFRPTLALWDARGGMPSPEAAAELRKAGVLSVLLWPREGDARPLDATVPAFGDAAHAALGLAAAFERKPASEAASKATVLRLEAAPDAAYRTALTSAPNASRSGVLCVQPPDLGREGLLGRAGVLDGSFGPFSGFHAAWGDVARDASCGALAYAARHASFCVLFDGPDAPSPLEAALRLSEGAVVAAEASLVARWADRGLAATVLPFEDADGLRRALEGAAKGRGREDALARQERLLDDRPALEDSCEAFLDECAALARRLGRAEVRAQQRPAREILLYGWFGMRNFGDDLLLMTAARRMARRWPESFAVAVGGNAAEVRRSFGLEAYTPDARHEVRSVLRRCAGAAFFGGLTFDDPMQETAGDIETFMDPWIEPSGQAAVCLEAWMSGVPAMYLGAGAGPLAKPAARNAVRTIGLSGVRFVLRDEHSARLVKDCGVPESQVSVKADLILGGRPLFDGVGRETLPEGLEDGGYLVVSLRDWPLVPEGFEGQVAACLDQVCGRFGLKAAFVPFDEDDVGIHRRTAALMRHADDAVVLQGRPAEQGILRLVSGSRAALAMRLHCSILHHVLGKPALGLDYNDKIGAHFRSVGQEGLLEPLSADGARMAAALSGALSDYEGACGAVRAGAAAGARLAEEAFQEFFDMVESSPGPVEEPACFHPRGRSHARCELERILRDLERARAEADSQRKRAEDAERRLEEVRTSRSFRLGHAVMAPLSRLLRGR